MLPAAETTIVADGLNLLIGQYRNKPNIAGVLTALLNRVQDAEDVMWDVIDSQLLTRTFLPGTSQGEFSGPPDQALLQTANLVGCPAGAFTSGQLAFLIQVWILARKSKGRMSDILALCARAFPGAGAFSYAESYPLAFTVTAPNVPDESLVAPLAQALTLARPPATAAVFAWGAWPTSTFYFGDSSPGGAAGSGLNDSVNPTTDPAGLLSAVQV